jgi:hypothetical protein
VIGRLIGNGHASRRRLRGVSLRQREGHRADGKKRQQNERAPEKVRFDGGINLFLHSGPFVTVVNFRKQSGASGGLFEHIDALLLDHSLRDQGKFLGILRPRMTRITRMLAEWFSKSTECISGSATADATESGSYPTPVTLSSGIPDSREIWG